MNKKGFTLIELLVVVAVIGVLASVVLSSLNTARAKTRDAKRLSDMKQVRVALELFYNNHGKFPVPGGGPTWDDHWDIFATCLKTGVGCGVTISNFTPVMNEVPQDPQDAPGSSDADPTYYNGWEGRTEQNYVIRARLETSHPALAQDDDGGWRSAVDGGCDDPWFCTKVNFPW